MNLFLLLKTKEDILKNHGYQTFHSMKKKERKKHCGSQWLPATVWYPASFKISSFIYNNMRTSV